MPIIQYCITTLTPAYIAKLGDALPVFIHMLKEQTPDGAEIFVIEGDVESAKGMDVTFYLDLSESEISGLRKLNITANI